MFGLQADWIFGCSFGCADQPIRSFRSPRLPLEPLDRVEAFGPAETSGVAKVLLDFVLFLKFSLRRAFKMMLKARSLIVERSQVRKPPSTDMHSRLKSIKYFLMIKILLTPFFKVFTITDLNFYRFRGQHNKSRIFRDSQKWVTHNRNIVEKFDVK